MNQASPEPSPAENKTYSRLLNDITEYRGLRKLTSKDEIKDDK
jgi:hypothetical protein